MNLSLKLAPQHRVYAGFMLYAIAMGSIFPRLPAIKQQMNVEEGALGLSLIGAPIGTLLALTFATPLLVRFGFRRSLLGSIPLIALAYAIAVHATAPWVFFLLLIPAGLVIGCAEIVVNVEADRTEALIGRRIMNRAHAFWSIGFFSAGLIGASMAHVGVSPQMHLALIVPITLLGVVLLLGNFQPAPARISATPQVEHRIARPTWPILVLVCVTLSAMLMEGAGIDWSAIYMRNLFDASPFLAGFAVAVIAGSQAIGRLFADGVIDRHSPRLVGRASLYCLAAGIVLVFFPISPWLSLPGFALIGLGTSTLFPMAMSAAAQRTDRSASTNVAALAQISFVAFLMGPPLLGFVAEHWGTQWVYGLGMPLVILSLLTVNALGDKPQSDAFPKAFSDRQITGDDASGS